MVRDPVATVASAHFRRHLRDQAFETTASDLYAHHGVLDEQLRRAAAPTLFIHYEDLVDRHNFRNATERIAGFLGYDADVVRGARQPRGLGEIAGPRRRRGERPMPQNQPHRQDIDAVFLLRAGRAQGRRRQNRAAGQDRDARAAPVCRLPFFARARGAQVVPDLLAGAPEVSPRRATARGRERFRGARRARARGARVTACEHPRDTRH